MIEKIENALNESRILILVAQVLLGFEYQSLFQEGFGTLPNSSQYLKLLNIGILLLALGILVSPVTYHHLVAKGNLTSSLHRFVNKVTMWALLPFVLSLSVGFYVAATKILNPAAGLVCAGLATVFSFSFWYGVEAIMARKKGKMKQSPAPPNPAKEATPLKERIHCVLTEARVVLPGTQALLGFQFAAILTKEFDALDIITRYVHLASLAAIGLSAIFLMAPAAYHRIVEHGEDSESLHTFATWMILAAMVCLAMGIAGSVFVAVIRILHSPEKAWFASVLTLLLFLGGWFGYMLWRRAERSTLVPPSIPSPSA